ncbi:hypothetical protein NIES2119_02935 [[Phormidium ambiguum] IAM M-71]|uniref:Plastid lipid-associated protein/fibrillin conserved domain-containing protein n=1 Tax=[Phormidium ambiguum] IAM M-71 TaxID=454136 RepID=A0A1U7IST9_9CYAN|nr:hypothetical protein [Phormidium ambiguum]OKH40577.1 hypothetical protein NIES2119_02935 [Phormidium ambiguum IAM M-71]
MTTNLVSSTTPDFLVTLAKATVLGQKSDRPPAANVVTALLKSEKFTKQQHINYPLESLIGSWRLHFVVSPKKSRQRSGIKMGNGFYVPRFVKANISFYPADANQNLNPHQLKIGNQLQVGLISFKFNSPAKFLGKKNLLAFDFTQIQVGFLGQTIYSGAFRGGQKKNQEFAQKHIRDLPFFAFFAIGENYIAARGRGGGLAIWVKEG